MKKIFVIMLFFIVTLENGAFFAAAPPENEAKMLVDLIREQTDSSVYTYLQKRIDESSLSEYQVEGKIVLEIFNGFNWQGSDKTLNACLRYSADKYSSYMIFDNGAYYTLVDGQGDELFYEEHYVWNALYDMIANEYITMEIRGKERTIVKITCFHNYEDGLVIYFQTTDGVFVRHYGYYYKIPVLAADKPLTSADYTLAEFTEATNQFANWVKREMENYKIQGISMMGRRSFSGYMSAGAPTPAPLLQPKDSIPPYIWFIVVGIVLIGCVGTGVILYHCKRRCAS